MLYVEHGNLRTSGAVRDEVRRLNLIDAMIRDAIEVVDASLRSS